MSLDVEALRADTPGCNRVVHLNHAGAALQPRPVLAAVRDHLDLEAAVGGYEAAARQEEALECFYIAAASLIGADPSEIAWMESASRAWVTAVESVGLQPGDRVLIAPSEFGTNVRALDWLARRAGAEVEVVALDALAEALDDRVRLVTLVHLGAHLGELEPVAEVGRLVREAGALFLLDVAQSAGHVPVDVGELGCHLLVGTGRKWLRGPRGTGFLYVAAEVLDDLDPPAVDATASLRTDAQRLEISERSVAGQLGLAAAMEYALALGIEAIAEVVTERAAALREELGAVPGLVLREEGPPTGIVTFTVDGLDPAATMTELRGRGINLSAIPPSFAPHALDAPVFRASPHYVTTHTELRALARGLTDLLSRV